MTGDAETVTDEQLNEMRIIHRVFRREFPRMRQYRREMAALAL